MLKGRNFKAGQAYDAKLTGDVDVCDGYGTRQGVQTKDWEHTRKKS